MSKNPEQMLKHQPSTKTVLVQAAHASLVNALILPSTGQEGFKNLENNPSYRTHKREFTIIPQDNTEEDHKHPFKPWYPRKMTSSFWETHYPQYGSQRHRNGDSWRLPAHYERYSWRSDEQETDFHRDPRWSPSSFGLGYLHQHDRWKQKSEQWLQV